MNKNTLLKEEIEIIEIFCNEMDRCGHKGFYSFYDNIFNGFYIFKERNVWIVRYNEKGKNKSEKRYTNIYNLCVDVLNDLRIGLFYFAIRDIRIPRGTRVVITKSIDCMIDDIKEGVIINSSIKVRGSTPEICYEVKGDDGKIYNGFYGLRLWDEICFRTMEDYIKDVNNEIEENEDTIDELRETNISLNNDLEYIMSKKKELLGDNSIQKRK